ncbi:uncharacterized protein LOC131594548 isoform X2 [Vicia villosa]|nr:uncharacterized protein LOC131594548 isoform X2 [Vicia villosa]
MENKGCKNVDDLFNEFAYKGSSEVEHPKRRVFLSPFFPYRGNTRNTFYHSCCPSRKVSKHLREVEKYKVGDTCRSGKVSGHLGEVEESKVGDSCPSRKVSKYFVKDGESKVGDSCPSRKVSEHFEEVGEFNVVSSCPSRKVSKYFVKDGESKVGDSCRSRKVPNHFWEVGESKEDDSCPSRKVSKYFQEVGEPEMGNSCPSRKTSKYFREVGESKVGESCPSRKVSKYFVKVEDSKVSDSCRSRNLLEHFREVEELELGYQKRVSPCPSRKVKNNCKKKSVTGFRECVKKRKCEGTRVTENLKVEDSSCLANIYEYLAKVEEIIIKGSLLLQKVSDSSREGFEVEENCMKEINDFLNQYVYHGRSLPISRKRVKKSEILEEGGDSEYRAKVKEAKVKFESVLDDLSNSFQEGPKVEEGSSFVPPKMKSKSRGKKNQPFLKAERYKEAYKRKTAENNWVPPRSHWNLIQEDHFHDPWRVLVICMLLNRTTGAQ